MSDNQVILFSVPSADLGIFFDWLHGYCPGWRFLNSPFTNSEDDIIQLTQSGKYNFIHKIAIVFTSTDSAVLSKLRWDGNPLIFQESPFDKIEDDNMKRPANRNELIGLLSTTSGYAGRHPEDAEEILNLLADCGMMVVPCYNGDGKWAGTSKQLRAAELAYDNASEKHGLLETLMATYNAFVRSSPYNK